MTAAVPPTPETGVPVCYRHPDRETYIRCQRCDRPICPDCMRDAAVGFQCPTCIKEGAKTTRSGRTAYGGLRPTDASRSTLVIIGINVVVWILIVGTGGDRSRLGMLLTLTPRGQCQAGNTSSIFTNATTSQACHAIGGGHWIPGVVNGGYWELVTSMFAHISPTHILFNMFALYIFGPQLELQIGRLRFVALYLIAGLGGSALVYAASDNGALGASGAIFGVIGATLVITYKVGGDVRGMLIYIAILFVFTIRGANISWQGHVGGFLTGLALGAIIAYAPRANRARIQLAGMGAVLAAILVAIAATTVALS